MTWFWTLTVAAPADCAGPIAGVAASAADAATTRPTRVRVGVLVGRMGPPR